MIQLPSVSLSILVVLDVVLEDSQLVGNVVHLFGFQSLLCWM